MIGQVWAIATVARANTLLGERPDRRLRALLALLPYGSTMLGAVAAGSARYPHALAIVDDDGAVTYAELWADSTSLARGLQAVGVGPHDRIGILCRNSSRFAVALLGGAKLGADLVFLNTGLAGPQLADVVEAERVSVLIHDTDFAEIVAPMTGPLRLDDAAVTRLVRDTPSGALAAPPRTSRLVILTSGTTGRPKGAARGADGAAAAATAALLGRIPLRARDTLVLTAPFFHAWGLANLTIGLALSATVVTRRHFDPERTLRDVGEYRARGLIAVPAMMQRICSLPPAVLAECDTSSLRVIACSGSALPGRLATEILDRFGPVLYNVYGSTEVATATIATPSELRSCPTTAGRPAPGVRVQILDGEGRPVAPGRTGRVFVGSASSFEGYTDGGNKEARSGLLATGDLGHLDSGGRLHIDGREDDMIVSGGENVYPVEVEELLGQHPDVAEVVVVGVADEKFGQALKAVVVLRDGGDVDADTLREFVRSRLARYKVPRSVEFLDELPRNATGKILRGRLT
ncbi:MAG TPA: AMP-binding protein [Sporichthya sp.]|nr:AMP-binding protein [Sporichthya sp.]